MPNVPPAEDKPRTGALSRRFDPAPADKGAKFEPFHIAGPSGDDPRGSARRRRFDQKR